jgi:hypothetical protein
VPQIYPIDIERAIDRRWQNRSRDRVMSVAQNDNDSGNARCPVCSGPASIAPTASDYRGKRIVQHQWACRECAQEWTTALAVPT